ncbi:hypothetical protein HPB50_001987 [Hyalomma asiaticum]|uniref:Uncharacterized protein n=1 Tax=Hyalomma asiaticum TaxID=266040 RepID=A0ACB7RIK7_HYAAI|nr:hypothetical protein HPB50_001987 [Hyalomma asiaticum]
MAFKWSVIVSLAMFLCVYLYIIYTPVFPAGHVGGRCDVSSPCVDEADCVRGVCVCDIEAFRLVAGACVSVPGTADAVSNRDELKPAALLRNVSDLRSSLPSSSSRWNTRRNNSLAAAASTLDLQHGRPREAAKRQKLDIPVEPAQSPKCRLEKSLEGQAFQGAVRDRQQGRHRQQPERPVPIRAIVPETIETQTRQRLRRSYIWRFMGKSSHDLCQSRLSCCLGDTKRDLTASFDPDQVDTTAGKLKGGAVDIYGVKLHRWLGVPYSQIGARSKRFAFAEPVNASSRIALYAAEPSPPCAQVINDTLLGREDCLRMNVWAPAQQSTPSASWPLLLVMTQDWFSRGTNNLPEWETLAAKANAVVMSPNVRLGVLGFLSRTSPADLDADLAIVDAMVAVSWALDNAAAFYADPSKLMLVGHGSGAYVLTAAAQALNLNCLRAVLEGPVPGSALPTNTDTIDTWQKLATVLGCRGDSEWEFCLQEAQLPDLLAAAANVTFRFGPSWDPSKWLHTPAAFQVQEIVAGVDVDEVRVFFEERVRPWAVAKGCAATVAQLYDCTLEYFFTNRTAAYLSLLRAFEPKTETDIVQLLGMLMSGCDTYRIARDASRAGYHYITEGSGRTLFEPVLDVDALAAFLKDGRAPVRNGMNAWHPVTPTHESSRVVFPNGTDGQGNTSSTLAPKPVLGQAKRKAPPPELTEAAMEPMEETPVSASTPAATLAKGSLAEILDRLSETIRAQSGAIEQQSEIIRQQSEAIATLNRRMGIMEAKVVDVSRPKVVGKVKKAQQNPEALAKCTTLKGMIAN